MYFTVFNELKTISLPVRSNLSPDYVLGRRSINVVEYFTVIAYLNVLCGQIHSKPSSECEYNKACEQRLLLMYSGGLCGEVNFAREFIWLCQIRKSFLMSVFFSLNGDLFLCSLHSLIDSINSIDSINYEKYFQKSFCGTFFWICISYFTLIEPDSIIANSHKRNVQGNDVNEEHLLKSFLYPTDTSVPLAQTTPIQRPHFACIEGDVFHISASFRSFWWIMTYSIAYVKHNRLSNLLCYDIDNREVSGYVVGICRSYISIYFIKFTINVHVCM